MPGTLSAASILQEEAKMLEIVFSESAAGCFKVAQHYGDGPYHSSVLGVFSAAKDSRRSTKWEIRQAKKKAEAEERAKWERAVPLGGNAGDVYCFASDYSVGDISGDGLSQARADSITRLFSFFPELLPDRLCAIADSRENLEAVAVRAAQGETSRIWYSDQPHEMCGLCWFITQLKSRMGTLPPMQAVRLPNLVRKDDVMINYMGWGGVGPEELHNFWPLSEEVIPAFAAAAQMKWRELQERGGSLRAVINGELRSVPESFYDYEIEAALAKMGNEFHEAELIGNILGRSQLGIGDMWIALRIEKMIQDGRLVPLTQPKPGDIIYRRMLKKAKQRSIR